MELAELKAQRAFYDTYIKELRGDDDPKPFIKAENEAIKRALDETEFNDREGTNVIKVNDTDEAKVSTKPIKKKLDSLTRDE